MCCIISGQTKMKPALFEKDDDSNGHIDFITAASVRIPVVKYQEDYSSSCCL